MNTSPQIESVQNNYEKYLTYRDQMGRYKKAVKGGFYFEALLIDYAMLEDRLLTFLYYVGAVESTFSEIKIPIGTSDFFEQLYGKKLDKNLWRISEKIRLIRKILNWAETDEFFDTDRKYQITLRKQIREQLDIPEFLTKLDEINNWKDYRDAVIHALMKKKSSSVRDQNREKTLEGMELARYIDRQISKIKKGNYLRRSMKAAEKG